MTLASLVLAAIPAASNADTSVPDPVPARNVSSDKEVTFRVARYRVEGNTVLDAGLIESLLAPYAGAARNRGDIEHARQALEQAYREAGYSMVRVIAPPQDITDGTVVFVAIEFKLGTVSLSGNRYHDHANIFGALPALVPGKVPSSAILAENLRLANENPSRRLDVALALGSEMGVMDAKVKVQDEPPQKISATFDNTGNSSTGMYRAGIAYQHNNLFNRDHAATLGYTTSPDHVREVTQLSASYRLPLYRLGDSLDFIAAYSDVNAGTTNTVAGPMAFSGKGHIYGARYNHYFARSGEYDSRLTAGLDYRAYANTCSVGDFGSAGCGSAAADTTVHPVSLTYNGAWNKASVIADFNATIAHNFAGGSHGGDADFAAARPSPLGGAGAGANYTTYLLNGSVLYMLPEDWRLRFAAKSQYTRNALISGEQFGLAGANLVRGFTEREAARDKGYVFNIEAYTPDLASKAGMTDSSLRLLAFADRALGWNQSLAGEADARATLASAGVGLRYDFHRSVSARLDWARVSSGAGSTKAGDSRGDVSVVVNF